VPRLARYSLPRGVRRETGSDSSRVCRDSLLNSLTNRCWTIVQSSIAGRTSGATTIAGLRQSVIALAGEVKASGDQQLSYCRQSHFNVGMSWARPPLRCFNTSGDFSLHQIQTSKRSLICGYHLSNTIAVILLPAGEPYRGMLRGRLLTRRSRPIV